MENKYINKTLAILVLLLFIFCKSKSTNVINKQTTASEFKLDTIATLCPENSVCTVEVLKNKTLNVSSDEFGGNYYKLGDDEFKKVIKYSFTKNKDPKYMDSGYQEEILFEIDNSDTNLTLKDYDLQKTKMLFGRFCYCKGFTGYYKIENGSFLLKKQKSGYLINLSFKIVQVPQIITKINQYVP